MTMITAFKFNDAFALGDATRQSQRRHGGLRSRTCKSEEVDQRVSIFNEIGKCDFQGRRRTKRRTFEKRLLDGLLNLWSGVTQNKRSPRQHKIDELVPIDILEIR